jgi:endonuclease/exonuclease/phosphatase family metal-dependent hydrolase
MQNLAKLLHISKTTAWFGVILTFSPLWAAKIYSQKSRRAESTLGQTSPKDQFSVMSYNCENLFDTVHDEQKLDWPFLPLAKKKTSEIEKFCAEQSPYYRRKECFSLDWTDEAFAQKRKNLADVILSVHGQGPDILVLNEIENKKTLDRLANENLANAKYRTRVLIEGEDRRGIDVGLLSRFELVGKPQLHSYAPGTRGLLQVELRLPNNEIISVFGFHFPSQMHPTEHRQRALERLGKLVRDLPKGRAYILAGDSNMTAKENRQTNLEQEMVQPLGLLSHRSGCASCRGTHFYRSHWDFLDWILVSHSLAKSEKYETLWDQVTTPDISQEQMKPDGTPKRFDYRTGTGASDHLPILVEIKMKNLTRQPTVAH